MRCDITISEVGSVGWAERGKISNSLPKFWGSCSSMRDLEVAKTTLPISIWGVPVRKRAGRLGYSHTGNPHFRIEFVSIWGLTYTVQLLFNDYYVLIFIFPDVVTHTIRMFFTYQPPIFFYWEEWIGRPTQITILP